jgi:hypothetical protein
MAVEHYICRERQPDGSVGTAAHGQEKNPKMSKGFLLRRQHSAV